jgi:hypothetical protein
MYNSCRKHEERPLARPRRGREDNIKTDLKEIVCGDKVRLLSLVNTALSLRVPIKAENFLIS